MEFRYEGRSLSAGIYKITNTRNGRVYIGSAKEFKRRWTGHAASLLKGTHRNRFLQADFNKCGTDAFVFEVLEVLDCGRDERLAREAEIIRIYFDSGDRCYNLCIVASSREGRKNFQRLSDETRAKMSYAKKALGANHPCKRQEVRDRIGNAHRGKIVSAAARAALYAHRLSRVGATNSAEHQRRLVESRVTSYDVTLISPAGEIVVGPIVNASAFARANGISVKHIHDLFSGKRLSVNGWRLYKCNSS